MGADLSFECGAHQPIQNNNKRLVAQLMLSLQQLHPVVWGARLNFSTAAAAAKASAPASRVGHTNASETQSGLLHQSLQLTHSCDHQCMYYTCRRWATDPLSWSPVGGTAVCVCGTCGKKMHLWQPLSQQTATTSGNEQQAHRGTPGVAYLLSMHTCMLNTVHCNLCRVDRSGSAANPLKKSHHTQCGKQQCVPCPVILLVVPTLQGLLVCCHGQLLQ